MKRNLLPLFFLFIFTFQVPAQYLESYAIPTYENASIHWKTWDQEDCKVFYKESSDAVWKQGINLWYDDRNNEYRGSLFKLKTNTDYHVKFITSSDSNHLDFKTLDENFPIGKTTKLPEGESFETIEIVESGSPDGYHLITASAGTKSTINLRNKHAYGIIIKADYVIIRGIEIINAAEDGIIMQGHRNDVVIEQCRIARWGSFEFAKNWDAAIKPYEGEGAEGSISRLTIQRNLIEDPNGDANDWDEPNGTEKTAAGYHPFGPYGITYIKNGKQIIVRYNNIRGSAGHYYHDAIQGVNKPGNDIYGNTFRNVWDDAIESDGDNNNTRIYANYFSYVYHPISFVPTKEGPIYVFRNVSGVCQRTKSCPAGAHFIKTGARNSAQKKSRRYILHNTILQPNGEHPDGNGADHAFSQQLNTSVYSRNNVYQVPFALSQNIQNCNFDYDYYCGNADYGELLGENCILTSEPPGEHIIDAGQVIPGVNDGYQGDAPDMGAFEHGGQLLEFGRRAYLAIKDDVSPWENEETLEENTKLNQKIKFLLDYR